MAFQQRLCLPSLVRRNLRSPILRLHNTDRLDMKTPDVIQAGLHNLVQGTIQIRTRQR